MKRALLLGGLFSCVLVASLFVWLQREDARAAVPVVRPFVVHEWGTFTSLSGSDGVYLPFYVNTIEGELPKFVYSMRGAKSIFHARTSMETPVLYFYTDKPREVSVTVDFALRDPRPSDPIERLTFGPDSLMTEWYPAAQRPVASQLSWPKVQLRPNSQGELPREKDANHYYEARDVDAVPVQIDTQVGTQSVSQQEKFLFYRGVSRGVASSLRVRAQGNGRFVIRNHGQDRAEALVLMQVKGGKISLLELGGLNGDMEKTVADPFQPATPEAATDTLVKGLVASGLYEKEARAMVATWRKAWFGDEGTRLLYVLPTASTDRLLPLKIEPKPDKIVRVLVGRIDILTPETERAIDAVIAKVDAAQSKVDQAASEAEKQQLEQVRNREREALEPFIQKLGRNYSPAVNASYTRVQQPKQ